jgi:predicted nucleic acid-binding protein
VTAAVIDASVVAACCFEDEAGSVADLEDLVAGAEALVPSCFRLEFANAIRSGVRRGRMPASIGREMIIGVVGMDWNVDPTDADSITVIHDLSVNHALTMYDASYLELAIRRGCALATLDAALIRAARAEGVTVVQLHR